VREREREKECMRVIQIQFNFLWYRYLYYSQLQIKWHKILSLFLKLCQRTKFLPTGLTHHHIYEHTHICDDVYLVACIKIHSDTSNICGHLLSRIHLSILHTHNICGYLYQNIYWCYYHLGVSTLSHDISTLHTHNICGYLYQNM